MRADWVPILENDVRVGTILRDTSTGDRCKVLVWGHDYLTVETIGTRKQYLVNPQHLGGLYVVEGHGA